MNSLFKGESVAERGTIAHLKEYFRHRSFSPKKVMDNFQHVWDFMQVYI